MFNDEKLNEIAKNLTVDEECFMTSLRKNLNLYISEPDITIKDISEKANISFSTLNSLLYGNCKDCKLSTVISLSKALNVSIDELVGAQTLDPITSKSLAICRNLPENALYLVRWYIKHQHAKHQKLPAGRRIISIMQVICNNNGMLKLSDNFKHLDITDLYPEVSAKIFFGITMPCEHYVPTYTPYDILLIANDRPPLAHEHSLVLVNDCLFIGQRKIVNGVAKFYSIRDGKYRMDEADVDEVIGYVAAVCPNALYIEDNNNIDIK